MDAVTEWAAVGAFALLPVAGVVLAVVTSGAFEIRYVLEFTLGTTLCLAAGVAAFVRGAGMRMALVVAGCLLAVAMLGRRAELDAANRKGLERLAMETSKGVTVMTDKEEYLWLQATYGAGGRVWVADLGREIAATRSDNIDRTMLNLQKDAGLPVLSYAELLQGAGQVERPFHMVVNDSTNPTNWLPAALTASGVRVNWIKSLGEDHFYQVDPLPVGAGLLPR